MANFLVKFAQSYNEQILKISKRYLNPQKPGRDSPAALLRSCCAVGDKVMVVKPSCNCHFWCSQQVENKYFGGFKKRLEKFCIQKFFFL